MWTESVKTARNSFDLNTFIDTHTHRVFFSPGFVLNREMREKRLAAVTEVK